MIYIQNNKTLRVSFKGPDHLQKDLFLKNHTSFAMPKKIRVNFNITRNQYNLYDMFSITLDRKAKQPLFLMLQIKVRLVI